jgi:hypothetical protein
MSLFSYRFLHRLVLTQRAGVNPERLRILDPHPSLLARWHACTANTGMTFLRSGAVHHLGFHPKALSPAARRSRAAEAHARSPAQSRVVPG